jgi:predicted RNase H-like HicB family nuclease
MQYAVVIEKAEGNYSAYVPDLPGCVATGTTIEEVREEIREAIVFHIDGLREDGIPIPEPTSTVDYIELAA